MKTFNAFWKLLSLSCFVSLFFLQSHAQDIEDVTINDLKEVQHPEYDSPAKYIFSHCKVNLIFNQVGGFSLERRVHERIKIYNENGLKYGDFEIPLFSADAGKKEKLADLKCVTHNLTETEKVVMIHLNKKEIFTEEEEGYEIKKFALPQVKEGSIIDIKYTIKSPFIYLIPKWYFQKDIPVDYSSYNIISSENISYTPIVRGIFPIEVDVIDNGAAGSKYFYSAKNIPPMEDDEFVLNLNDYKSSVKLELHSINIPGVYRKDYTTNWATICGNLKSDDDFGVHFKKNMKYHKGVTEKCQDMTAREKAEFLFKHVRDSYQWNGKYSRYPENGMKKLYEEETGNSTDMNFLLISLLREAGLESNPILTKNRNDGVFNSYIPSLTELNYVLTLVTVDGSDFVLDPSDKNCRFGMLPHRAMNISGVLMDMDNVQVVDLVNPNVYQYMRSSTMSYNQDQNILEGEGREQYKLYAAKRYRDRLNESEEEEEEIEEEVEDVYEAIESTGVEDKEGDIKVEFESIIQEDIIEIGDEIFINADLNMGIDENPFHKEEREFPVFFPYKYNVRYVTTIALPENLAVQSMPESVVYNMNDNLGSFMYDAKHIGNNLIINYVFVMKADIIMPIDYPDLKTMYDNILQKRSEKIVLKKI